MTKNPSRNVRKNITSVRIEKKLIRARSVQSDKGKKGTLLTGSDIIFAFEKIKEHVVTHRRGKSSVGAREVNTAAGLRITPYLRELGFETKCVCIH